MKVILLESVPKVGNVNEIVEVSDGYAMNKLIPSGLARAANAKNVAEVEARIKENKARDDARKEALATAIQSLDKKTITITASANEQGTLFSAISAADLAEHIKEQANVDIEPSYIELGQAIKETGEHKVIIKMGDKIKSNVVINIAPEQE